MIKIKKVLPACCGALILMAMTMAYAQDQGPGPWAPKGHPGQRMEDIFNRLNLTADQKKQLDANKEQHRAKMKSAHQGMKAAGEAIKEELMKPQLDMPKIMKIHERIKALQSQAEDDKLNSILAVRAILTPDQFSRFVSLMDKHRQGQNH